MAGEKIGVEFQIQEDLVKMLDYAAENTNWVINIKLFDASWITSPRMRTGMKCSKASAVTAAVPTEAGPRKNMKSNSSKNFMFIKPMPSHQ